MQRKKNQNLTTDPRLAQQVTGCQLTKNMKNLREKIRNPRLVIQPGRATTKPNLTAEDAEGAEESLGNLAKKARFFISVLTEKNYLIN